jgi:predicted transcriptional regulator
MAAGYPYKVLEAILAISDRSLRAGDLAETEFWFVEPDWLAGQALTAMDEANIDSAPIRDSPIQRYVTRSDLKTASPDARVTNGAVPIRVTHLVTRDMGLASVLDLLVDRDFLFVLEQGSVAGIVTQSDVQRVPVNMMVLALILAAEAGLDVLIEAAYGREGWLDQLTDNRRSELEKRYSERLARNSETGKIDLLMLEDRLRLIARRKELRVSLGFSRSEFDDWSEALKRTRDELAHGRRGQTADLRGSPNAHRGDAGRRRTRARQRHRADRGGPVPRDRAARHD